MKTRGTELWLSALAFVVAAVLLGHALQLTNGALSRDAMLRVLGAFALCLLGVVAPRVRLVERLGEGPVLFALGLAVVFQLGLALTSAPGIYLRSGTQLAPYHKLAVLFAVLSGALLSTRRPGLGRWAMPALLLAFWFFGVWLLEASPRPAIDVYSWTSEALTALAAGKNPFVGPMPNIYGHTRWYAPGYADAQWVLMGYPYPPLGLLLGGLGRLLTGEFRYANLAFLALAGACMAWARGGRVGFGAAAVFLCTPRMLFVLEQAWTDAYVVGLLGLTVFLACRAPKLTPFAFGLLVVSKQYALFLAPLALLLVEGPWTARGLARFAVKAAVPAALVTLPFVLWDPRAFLDSVFIIVEKNPFRTDALSLAAFTAKDGVQTLPSWAAFLSMSLALGLGLLRGARSPAGFAGASALVFGAFFLFSRHAFCNHHFLVLGALLLAVAAMRPGRAAPVGATQATAA